MATKTLQENVNQAINDLCEIRQALINKGVECPSGTPTCEYGEKINEIKSGDTTDLKEVIERTAVNPKLPSDLTKIGNYAFYYCTSLALTELPDSITSIGSYAFNNCRSLALTELPKNLKSTGRGAFYGCKNLALTKLPDGMTRIEQDTFQNCDKITSMELPDSITSIGSYAFSYCDNLKSVTFKGTPKTISSPVFSNCTNLITIRVPWAEDEIANAPWGATNATIVYNYTETE